jgi:hypothetical protein
MLFCGQCTNLFQLYKHSTCALGLLINDELHAFACRSNNNLQRGSVMSHVPRNYMYRLYIAHWTKECVTAESVVAVVCLLPEYVETSGVVKNPIRRSKYEIWQPIN